MAEFVIFSAVLLSPVILKYVQEYRTKKAVKKIFFKKRTNKKIDENCVICFEKMNDKERKYVLHCNHSYHKKCITKWLRENVTCPLCNLPLQTKNGKRLQITYY